MKNDLVTLFTRLKAHDGAYQNTEFSVGVLAQAFACSPEDFGSGKVFQVDHFIPQSPHLDPENHFDQEFIAALELEPDMLKEVNGKPVYIVRGSEIIDAVFEKFLPELPADMRPSIDNIVNLRPLTSVANNRKSNRLSGTMEMMFETLCGHAQGYAKHIADGAGKKSVLDLAREFGNTAPEIVKVLEAIDIIDKARSDSAVNKKTHLEMAGMDLVDVFANASERTGFDDGFMLQKHMMTSERGVVTGNHMLIEKMAVDGVKLTDNFTGTVVNLNGNFRESYDRFRVAFVSHAKEELAKTREAMREIEQQPRLVA